MAEQSCVVGLSKDEEIQLLRDEIAKATALINQKDAQLRMCQDAILSMTEKLTRSLVVAKETKALSLKSLEMVKELKEDVIKRDVQSNAVTKQVNSPTIKTLEETIRSDYQ